MGCCQSRATEENDNRNSESLTLPDVCYPDKIGFGGVKVLTSSASSSGVSTSSLASRGRTYTRLVIGRGWLFAALFEAHGGIEKGGNVGSRDAAARFCAAHCYAEFQRAMEGAAHTSKGTSTDSMRTILVTTLRALDRRFLSDDGILPQDRLASGCIAVLLHISLGEKPLATVASVGPCAAVVGQRRGGLASATSAPLVLCGGASSSHGALQDFLTALDSEQPGILAATVPAGTLAKKGRKLFKSSPAASSKDMSQRRASPATLQGGEPEYSRDSTAPQALGFGYGKCMKVVPNGRGTVDEPREPRVGLEVQTAFYELGPVDDCVVLLSGGAAAGISPVDVALLMHRMGRLAAIPYETKPRPLPHDVSRGPVAQLDNLGVVGPPPAPALAAAAHTIKPFNAARLLVQQAVANVAARGQKTSGVPVGVMAFALEWPRSSDDSGAAAAAIGASVSAVCAAAAAAVSSRQRAQYRWQLLRLYYKFPHKRRVVIINKWHEVFDRVVGEGKRTANIKETAAWLRLGAAVKVSAAGNVQCLSSREEATEQLAQTPKRRSSPAPHQEDRSTVGGVLSASAVHGMGGQRLQGRPPLSAAGAANTYSSPGTYQQPAGSAAPQSPIRVASSNAMLGHRSPSLGVTNLQQRSPSLSSGAAKIPRSSSHRESALAAATAVTAAIIAAAGPDTGPMTSSAVPRASTPAGPTAPPSRQGPVGLLEVEGIDMQRLTGPKVRGNEATEGGYQAVACSSLAGMSRKSLTADGGAVYAAAAAAPPAAAASGLTLPEWSIAWGNMKGDSGFHSADALKLGPNEFGSSRASSNLSVTPITVASVAKQLAVEAAAAPSPSISKPPAQRASGRNGVVEASGAATSVVPAATPKSTSASAATAAVAVPRIPSRSAGSAPVTSPSDSTTAATDCSPSNCRSPRSRIPTLMLKPGPVGAAATAHETPRLSMPGGTPIYRPTPASSAVQPATVNATPRVRGSSTWGGAAPTSIPSATPGTAPNSARSGSSRLPRAPNLSTPSAAPSVSPAGSISNRSIFTGSDAGSVPRAAIARPPRLEVAACGLTGQPTTGAPAANDGDDLDIFSPDAEQLAAWAMEAVDAIGASAKKLSLPQQQQEPQDSTPMSSRNVKSGLSRTFSDGRSGGAGTSGGGARSTVGSRIPLSPRNNFNTSNNNINLGSNSDKFPSYTPSRGSVGKPTPTRTLSNTSMGASPDFPTPQSTNSARSRR